MGKDTDDTISFLRELPQIGREPTVTRNAVIIVNIIHIMRISFIDDLY
jgi:hypothetical protein